MVGIESDGGQHYEDKGRESDEIRTKELKELGVEIIRFSDREVLTNIDGVYEIIRKVLEEKIKPLTSILSPAGRGGKRRKN